MENLWHHFPSIQHLYRYFFYSLSLFMWARIYYIEISILFHRNLFQKLFTFSILLYIFLNIFSVPLSTVENLTAIYHNFISFSRKKLNKKLFSMIKGGLNDKNELHFILSGIFFKRYLTNKIFLRFAFLWRKFIATIYLQSISN